MNWLLKNFNLLKNLIYFYGIMFNMVFFGKLYLNDELLKIHKGGRISPGESLESIC